MLHLLRLHSSRTTLKIDQGRQLDKHQCSIDDQTSEAVHFPDTQSVCDIGQHNTCVGSGRPFFLEINISMHRVELQSMGLSQDFGGVTASHDEDGVLAELTVRISGG